MSLDENQSRFVHLVHENYLPGTENRKVAVELLKYRQPVTRIWSTSGLELVSNHNIKFQEGFEITPLIIYSRCSAAYALHKQGELTGFGKFKRPIIAALHPDSTVVIERGIQRLHLAQIYGTLEELEVLIIEPYADLSAIPGKHLENVSHLFDIEYEKTKDWYTEQPILWPNLQDKFDSEEDEEDFFDLKYEFLQLVDEKQTLWTFNCYEGDKLQATEILSPSVYGQIKHRRKFDVSGGYVGILSVVLQEFCGYTNDEIKLRITNNETR